MRKLVLRARDVERLENTSIASALLVAGQIPAHTVETMICCDGTCRQSTVCTLGGGCCTGCSACSAQTCQMCSAGTCGEGTGLMAG